MDGREKKKINTRKGREDFTREAYLGIRKMFFHNEIIPGQKISYRDLAERLDMSATPVIQALKRLEFQGFVRHEPNRGYYTEKISIKEITEIYEFREMIELSLLPKTIRQMTPDSLKKIESALEKHLNAVRDIYLKERLLRDMEFHLTLAELSNCTLQVNTLKHLFDLLYLKYRGNILFVTPMETVDNEHSQLYEFIASGDVDGAVAVMARHIANVRKHAIISINRVMEEKDSHDKQP
ncbi:HTH-type transcriptional regulator (GntR family protein) [Desulfamplus magnetovallimortis]|uniref:HTH-type transcriptional regulator (GntR family protein) n=1 Tax=Desulfamplus magnetovallimortis TaxID=1246637 RepID=A0A1W1HH40_9BACT|nr:GntR family transcriptional regulator [Desulfamplus magnetovallimortis]SLM31817.1 HTH-type transcriptional regulator (GntR family protein) [Desulfamplus magnetovallimortis]